MARNVKRQSSSYKFICSDDDDDETATVKSSYEREVIAVVIPLFNPELEQKLQETSKKASKATSKASQGKKTTGPKLKKQKTSASVGESNEAQEDAEVPDETVKNSRVTRRKSKSATPTNDDEEYTIRLQTRRSSSKSPAYDPSYYSAYRIEEDDEEINERKVNNMVKIFVNTFKRNPDLWQSFKNVVDGSSEELPITPIPISSSSKGGKISYANTNRLPNTEDRNPGTTAATKEDKDFLMELKCLFLRSRNPPTSAFQYIIENIWPKYVVNSAESGAYLSKAHKCFDSFRNELNKNMAALARQFIKDKGLENDSTFDRNDITNYVDEAIIRKCLALCLRAVHNSSTNNSEFFKILKKFVRLCLFFHVQHIINGDDKPRYFVDVLEKVKSREANETTKELLVHSLSGLNLANDVTL